MLTALSAQGAETPVVQRVSAPAWVEYLAPDVAGGPAPASEDGNGIQWILRDEQAHAGEQTSYRHYAMRFLSQDGVQNGSTLTTSFDPGYETLAFHQLIVRREGRATDRLAQQEIQLLHREPNLEDQLYDGRLTATLILGDIRVGDVVEYAYSVKGANPIFGGHYLDTFSTQWHPALSHWRQRLLWPAGRTPPDIQCHGTVQTPQIHPLQDGRLLDYRWAADALPGRQSDGDLPSWVDTYGWVQVSDFTSWNEVARWAAKLFGQAVPAESQPLPEALEREAQSIRALPDRRAQVVAALRYVQDNYRYLGIEIGANTHQPYSIAIVCERRFGDCKDKANLLSTLLRRLGFDADPALVETDYRHTIADWHPTPLAFDHAVVRLQFEGATYWLDPTRANQGGTLGHLFFPSYGKALVVREDTRDLADIVPSGLDDCGTEITRTYRQKNYPDPTELTVRTVCHGRDADRIRSTFAGGSHEKLQTDYLNFYAKEHAKIRSLAPIEFSDERDRNEVIMIEHYEVSDSWGVNDNPEEKRLYLRFHARELREHLDLPGTRLRTMPFALVFPDRVKETIEAYLPGLPDIKAAHAEVKDDGFDFSFKSETIPSRKALQLTYQYAAKADVVEAPRMPEYLLHTERVFDHVEYELSTSRQFYASHSTSPASGTAEHRMNREDSGDSSGGLFTDPTRIAVLLTQLSILVLLPVSWAVLKIRARKAARARNCSSDAALHCCAVCGRTETDSPELEFRVSADGQDYCNEHSSSATHGLTC